MPSTPLCPWGEEIFAWLQNLNPQSPTGTLRIKIYIMAGRVLGNLIAQEKPAEKYAKPAYSIVFIFSPNVFAAAYMGDIVSSKSTLTSEQFLSLDVLLQRKPYQRPYIRKSAQERLQTMYHVGYVWGAISLTSSLEQSETWQVWQGSHRRGTRSSGCLCPESGKRFLEALGVHLSASCRTRTHIG